MAWLFTVLHLQELFKLLQNGCKSLPSLNSGFTLFRGSNGLVKGQRNEGFFLPSVPAIQVPNSREFLWPSKRHPNLTGGQLSGWSKDRPVEASLSSGTQPYPEVLLLQPKIWEYPEGAEYPNSIMLSIWQMIGGVQSCTVSVPGWHQHSIQATLMLRGKNQQIPWNLCFSHQITNMQSLTYTRTQA